MDYRDDVAVGHHTAKDPVRSRTTVSNTYLLSPDQRIVAGCHLCHV